MDQNRGTMVLEAIALPAAPKPLSNDFAKKDNFLQEKTNDENKSRIEDLSDAKRIKMV